MENNENKKDQEKIFNIKNEKFRYEIKRKNNLNLFNQKRRKILDNLDENELNNEDSIQILVKKN